MIGNKKCLAQSMLQLHSIQIHPCPKYISGITASPPKSGPSLQTSIWDVKLYIISHLPFPEKLKEIKNTENVRFLTFRTSQITFY